MKKFKKWLIGVLLGVLPYILLAGLVISGFSSVFSFFTGMTKWSEKENIDINNCTIDQMILAVKDKEIFTPEMLNDMMINRKSLLLLLEEVRNYNNRTESKDIYVEYTYTYIEAEVTYEDEVKKTNPKYDITEHTGTQWVTVSVDNNNVISGYKLDWQTLYLMCVYKAISNYEIWDNIEDDFDDADVVEQGEPITLSKKDVKEIINKFRPKLIYSYDVVNNSKLYYNTEDVKDLKTVASSYTLLKEGGLYWHYAAKIPVSVLAKVDAPAYTDIYGSDRIININTYSCKERFLELGQSFDPYFEIDTFLELMENLPGGIEIANKYKYIFSLPELEVKE